MANESVATAPGFTLQESDFCRDEEEMMFLVTYRQADEAGKKRIRKLAAAAVNGLLPPAEQIEAMTRVQLDSFIWTLPEVQS